MNGVANGVYGGVEGYVIPGTNSGVGGGLANGVYGELPAKSIPMLDTYRNASHAYSLRRLNSSYAGPAIRVRRSNDNSEADINFDVNGNLNEIQLIGFVGANDGFVSAWYDQSGNARNLIQGTAANQPRIVNLGVIQKTNNKVSIFFNGTSSFLGFGTNIDTSYLHQSGSSAIFSVQTSANVATQFSLSSSYRIGTAETGYLLLQNSDGSFTVRINNAGTAVSSNTTASSLLQNNTQFLLSILLDNANATAANRSYLYYNTTLYQNNVSTGTPSTGVSTRNPTLGVQAFFSSNFWSGTISEFILYNSDQLSNGSGIQNNINNYYKIY